MFRLLGFDVHVRPGFVVFALLIVVVYGNEFGLWLAGSLAGFTLLHELAHAIAARRAEAQAEISLNFMAGYTAYVPTRPISRAESAWISLAGPATQIVVSAAVLVAMGANPLDLSAVDDSAATLAVWWAGPVIGLANLIPILPLDGGNIALNGLDRIIPGRSRRPMLYFSIAVTAVAGVASVVAGYRGLLIFVGFLVVAQLQMLGATRPPSSPWQDAGAALAAGRPRRARRILVAALSAPRPDRAPPAAELSDRELGALIDLLPEPFPHGDPWNEYVLTNSLLRVGRYEDAAHYAAEGFARHPHSLAAANVARAAGALGDEATAIGWLRTAADTGTSAEALATVIDRSPELRALRTHPDVVAIRRSLTPA